MEPVQNKTLFDDPVRYHASGGGARAHLHSSSSSTQTALQTTGGQHGTHAQSQMPPPPPREPKRPKKKVLDEDEWLEHVENIIERHFFPDLKQLQQQRQV